MTEQEKAIIRLASEAAIEAYRREHKRTQERASKKIRENTKKLLKNYNGLKTHCALAIESSIGIMPNQLQLMLSEIFDHKGYIKVQAIACSKERTSLMLTHVTTMLNAYAAQCKKTGRMYYEVIDRLYVNGEAADEIAEALHVDERTVWRYAEQGIDDMSVLLWGLTSLSVNCQ